jgi:hypothetical protein
MLGRTVSRQVLRRGGESCDDHLCHRRSHIALLLGPTSPSSGRPSRRLHNDYVYFFGRRWRNLQPRHRVVKSCNLRTGLPFLLLLLPPRAMFLVLVHALECSRSYGIQLLMSTTMLGKGDLPVERNFTGADSGRLSTAGLTEPARLIYAPPRMGEYRRKLR